MAPKPWNESAEYVIAELKRAHTTIEKIGETVQKLVTAQALQNLKITMIVAGVSVVFSAFTSYMVHKMLDKAQEHTHAELRHAEEEH